MAVTPYLLVPEGAVLPPGVVLGKPAPEAAPAPEPAARIDACEVLVKAMCAAASALGSSTGERELRALLLEGRLEEEVAAETRATLVARGYLDADGCTPSSAFLATREAWTSAVRGNEADLSVSGSTTLDNWAAKLLCTLAGAPRTREGDYRRELRRRGVAAFGLLAV